MNTNGPTVTFWGAARTVTGSMHLIEAGGVKLLLDCGTYQGHRAEARERNSNFPFDPRSINAVILSHAHIDHSGNLPNLVKQGFAGPIFCTPATRDLAAIMLADSARIQEEDAFHLNRKRPRGEPPIEPLYTTRNAKVAVGYCYSVPYDRLESFGPNIRFRFVDAGHILGSAMVALEIDAGSTTHRLTFTGDLGRRGLPILRDPAPVPPGDFLISESTYGGRTHEPVEELAENLRAVVQRTIDRGGKIIIPAFSLGRTQTMIYFFHQLRRQGHFNDLPIFVDSPLAADATQVFQMHPECFDDETAELLLHDADLFSQKRIIYTRSVEDSKALNERREPCVIIAASGMCEAGRIQHHLKQNIEDAKNTVLVIGFQAEHTLGRRIVERRPWVRIHDRDWKLRAEVAVLSGFSSHADHGDFLAFLGPLAGRTKQVCLVHGEVEPAMALAKGLGEIGFRSVGVPERGERFSL